MANWRKIARHPFKAARWYAHYYVLRHAVNWWLRRPYAPWSFLSWLDDREYYCWAEVVAWKICESEWPGRNTNCITGPSRDGKDQCVTCWCGYWDRVGDGSIRLMRENQRRGLPAFAGSEKWPQFSVLPHDSPERSQ